MTIQSYRIPIVVEPYPGGVYGVRSPLFPELISEGDTFEEAVRNAQDAARAVLELYEDIGKPLPGNIVVEDANKPVDLDIVTTFA